MGATLTGKFEKAIQFAIECHHGQVRKGSGAPYISHPLAVASIVLEYGGSEDQAIAALLHDALEDCGITREEVAERFGEGVARIVADCSDWQGPEGAKKSPWRERKEQYIAHLPEAHADSILVSAADKLHNASAIAHDAFHYGPEVWKRFSAEPREILWYYHSLLAFFKNWAKANGNEARFGALVHELGQAIKEMERLASPPQKAAKAAKPKKKKALPK